MPRYFVVTDPIDADLKGTWPEKQQGNTWNIANHKMWLKGFISVFEREDAARAEFNQALAKRGPDSIITLHFIRAWTKHGAAKAVLNGEGELLVRDALTKEQQQAWHDSEAQDRRERAEHDIPLYRALIEDALKRHPTHRTHFTIDPMPDNPETEKIHLSYFVAGLFRCGAIPREPIERFQKTLRSGYSDHLRTDLYTELPAVTVPAG